jgi:hypothetical protein
VKESGIGEDAVKIFWWKLKAEKVLMPHLTAAVLPGELNETFCAFKAGSLMAQLFEGLEISPRPAPEIQNSTRWFAADMFKKCITILAYVVILGAFPETIRVFVIIT